ncbi:MAG: hypothetical protein MJ238_04475 [Bacilli bacterium]|nr:hypothetical protein [Bacilli bacterium]
MLIGSIINASLSVIIYVAIVFYFSKENKKYELKTSVSKMLKVLGHIFYFLFGLIFSVGALIAILKEGENSVNLATLITSASFGFISLLFIFLIYTQFEAVEGNEIFIRRFIKIRTIAIDDVRSIDSRSNGFVIQCKNGIAFTIDIHTIGAEDFIKILRERTNSKIYSLSPYTNDDLNKNNKVENGINEEQSSLIEIGREFRKFFP